MCVAGEKVEVFFFRQKTTKCALGGGVQVTTFCEFSLFKIQIINNRCPIIYNQRFNFFLLRFPQILPLRLLYSREYDKRV